MPAIIRGNAAVYAKLLENVGRFPLPPPDQGHFSGIMQGFASYLQIGPQFDTCCRRTAGATRRLSIRNVPICGLSSRRAPRLLARSRVPDYESGVQEFEFLPANRFAAAWKRRRQRSGQGYDHLTKVVTRERDGHRVGCERQSTCLDQTLQEAACSPLS